MSEIKAHIVRKKPFNSEAPDRLLVMGTEGESLPDSVIDAMRSLGEVVPVNAWISIVVLFEGVEPLIAHRTIEEAIGGSTLPDGA